jgi:hypothetical protein
MSEGKDKYPDFIDPDFLDEVYRPTKHKTDKPVANTNPHYEKGRD